MKYSFSCLRAALLLLVCLVVGCNENTDSSIVVESNPPGASVLLDGNDLGTTPVNLTMESMGLDLESIPSSSQIVLDLKGYHPQPVRLFLGPPSSDPTGYALMFSAQSSTLLSLGMNNLNVRLISIDEDPWGGGSTASKSWPFR